VAAFVVSAPQKQGGLADIWWLFVLVVVIFLIAILLLLCCLYCLRNTGETYKGLYTSSVL